jgi:hypothetical protein
VQTFIEVFLATLLSCAETANKHTMLTVRSAQLLPLWVWAALVRFVACPSQLPFDEHLGATSDLRYLWKRPTTHALICQNFHVVLLVEANRDSTAGKLSFFPALPGLMFVDVYERDDQGALRDMVSSLLRRSDMFEDKHFQKVLPDCRLVGARRCDGLACLCS